MGIFLGEIVLVGNFSWWGLSKGKLSELELSFANCQGGVIRNRIDLPHTKASLHNYRIAADVEIRARIYVLKCPVYNSNASKIAWNVLIEGGHTPGMA